MVHTGTPGHLMELIVNVITFTSAFPAMTSHDVCCEEGPFRCSSSTSLKYIISKLMTKDVTVSYHALPMRSNTCQVKSGLHHGRLIHFTEASPVSFGSEYFCV